MAYLSTFTDGPAGELPNSYNCESIPTCAQPEAAVGKARNSSWNRGHYNRFFDAIQGSRRFLKHRKTLRIIRRRLLRANHKRAGI